MQYIASPSFNFAGDQIFPVVWEVVEALEMYRIPVVSVTSDGAKPNTRMCQQTRLAMKLPYKTANPYHCSNTCNSSNEDLFSFVMCHICSKLPEIALAILSHTLKVSKSKNKPIGLLFLFTDSRKMARHQLEIN